jgi:ribosome-associated protein
MSNTPTPDPIFTLVQQMVRALADKKAEDLRVLKVSGKSTITDYLVLATGNSDPHLRALRIEVERVLDEVKHPICGMEVGGYGSGWTVVDAYQIMAHIFTPEQRGNYALERLWKDAESINISKLIEAPKPVESVTTSAAEVVVADKPVSKKAVEVKAVKAVAKKTAVKKVVKAVASKKTVVKKAVASKTVAVAAKKAAVVKKAVVAKRVVKKAVVAKKAAVKTSAAVKKVVAVKKTAVVKKAVKPVVVVKKAVVKKVAAKKVVAKKVVAKKRAK